MNLFMMAPLDFLQALSTVVDNNVSKLSIIKSYGGGSLPNFSLLITGITNLGASLNPGPATISLSWRFIFSVVLGVRS